MGCSVLWKPVCQDAKYVGKGQFRDIIGEAFGYPCVLNHHHIEFLKGILASGHEEVKIIIDAIYAETEIELSLAI